MNLSAASTKPPPTNTSAAPTAHHPHPKDFDQMAQPIQPPQHIIDRFTSQILDAVNYANAYRDLTPSIGLMFFDFERDEIIERAKQCQPGYDCAAVSVWEVYADTADENAPRHAAETAAREIALDWYIEKRNAVKRRARAQLYSARIIARVLERARLTAREAPGGQRLAKRRHMAALRIDKMCRRNFIKATNQPEQFM